MTSTSIYQETPLSYVYRLDHQTTGEFYFGFRKANIVPASKDLGIEYFTSSKYVKPRFHEFNYTIIQEFIDPTEAYDLEQFLIYQELKNPLILNRRCYYGSKSRFTTASKNHSQETKNKIAASRKGIPRGPHSQETKDKMSAAKNGVPRVPRVPCTPEQNAANSARQKDVPKPKFFSIIKTKKTYDKGNLSRHYPEFKIYY